ncbi:hypothetical protein ES695_16740 [Candidatus Atribacteria bacterium 1244-E10-H5-B2]|nr:MAG: hypothetical protein ES695_16740 [Candidatus Atribacteria bacterium 1244-E10-H5-B2]
MTKTEYRKIIWGILKDYRDDEIKSLEELLKKIMAIPTPKEIKNPYEGMSTREDVDFGKGKKKITKGEFKK